MALVRSGALAEAVSGTVGGVTFSQTRNGTVVAQRGLKCAKDTEAVLYSRAMMLRSAAVWNLVPEENQTRWNNLGRQVTYQNRVGLPYQLSGRASFLKHWGRTGAAIVAVLTVVPEAVRLPRMTRVLPSFSESGNYSVRVYPQLDDADVSVVFYGARTFRTHETKAPQYWRYLGTGLSTTTWHSVKTAWLGIYGPVEEGEWTYIRAHFWATHWVQSSPVVGGRDVLS